jgi:hypothetical protein
MVFLVLACLFAGAALGFVAGTAYGVDQESERRDDRARAESRRARIEGR